MNTSLISDQIRIWLLDASHRNVYPWTAYLSHNEYLYSWGGMKTSLVSHIQIWYEVKICSTNTPYNN